MYDDFFSDVLIQYKECLDEKLSSLFLHGFRWMIRLRYHGCVFVSAPSSNKKKEIRGFDHVEKMFEGCGRIVRCFEKTDDVLQKTASLKERKKIEEHLIFHEELLREKKRIVLIDDVATTGSTLLAMQKMIGEKRCKEALVVAIHPKLLTDFDKKSKA